MASCSVTPIRLGVGYDVFPRNKLDRAYPKTKQIKGIHKKR